MGLKIGIDINDVIRDFSNNFLRVYKGYYNQSTEMTEDDINSLNYFECFDFEDNDDYMNFRYSEYVFELYGNAKVVDIKLPVKFNEWVSKTLTELDVSEDPEIVLFSPFEQGASIQATLGFLSKNLMRVREYYFPIDSIDIFNRCDIVITANPRLINECPDGKTVVKINKKYNEDCECDICYDNLMGVIGDVDEKIIKIIKNEDER